MVDHFLRMIFEDANEHVEINEKFLDERLFTCDVASIRWCANIVNFLACKVVPEDLSWHQVKKFLHEVRRYIWDEPFLFGRCTD